MYGVLHTNGVRRASSRTFSTIIRYATKGPFIDDPNRIQPVPQVVHRVEELRKTRDLVRSLGKNIAFVPTMGALHQGHLSMIRHAAKGHNEVYVSIYVNPTQFGLNEDLTTYPKTLEQDLRELRYINERLKVEKSMGRVTMLFCPTNEEMYPGIPPTSDPNGDGSFVTITPLGKLLEGASRPVFFRGVATVCMKLLNIVQPEHVYFGQKDIQQCIIIQRMIKDFHINTKMYIRPTSREADGLALSSRNVYLGARRRAAAIVLTKAIQAGQQAFQDGKRTRDDVLGSVMRVTLGMQEAQNQLPPSERARFEVDYMSLADPVSLEEIPRQIGERGAILSGAIKMLPLEEPQESEDAGIGGGKSTVRLIDNAVLCPFSRIIGNVISGA